MVSTRNSRYLSRLCLSFIVLCAATALAGNVTVDDTDPGIVYSPNWLSQPGADPTSLFQPAHAYKGTWRDTSVRPSDSQPHYFEYTFAGTAIYIYGVVGWKIKVHGEPIDNVDLTLVIDGVPARRDFHALQDPLAGQGYLYRLLLHEADLTNAEHTIRVDVGPSSNALFDMLVYTAAEPPQGTSDPGTTTSDRQAPPSTSNPPPSSAAPNASPSNLSSASSIETNSTTSTLSSSSSSGPAIPVDTSNQFDVTTNGTRRIPPYTIAGIAVGVTIFLLLVGLAGFLYARHHRMHSGILPTPVIITPPADNTEASPPNTKKGVSEAINSRQAAASAVSSFSGCALLKTPVNQRPFTEGLGANRFLHSASFRPWGFGRNGVDQQRIVASSPEPVVHRLSESSASDYSRA